MTTFSDSIVVSCPLDPEDKGAVEWAVHFRVAETVPDLIAKGTWIGGGISPGWLHHQGRIVVGEGLIRAYRLESAVARYPRVVLEEEVARAIQVVLDSSGSGLRDLLPSIRVDPKGLHYIDPFWLPVRASAGSDGSPRLSVDVEKPKGIRDNIERDLGHAQGRNDDSTLEKMRWLAAEFDTHAAPTFLPLTDTEAQVR